MNSVMDLIDFIEDMAFKPHVEDRVDDHQLEREMKEHPSSQNCMS